MQKSCSGKANTGPCTSRGSMRNPRPSQKPTSPWFFEDAMIDLQTFLFGYKVPKRTSSFGLSSFSWEFMVGFVEPPCLAFAKGIFALLPAASSMRSPTFNLVRV